MKKQYIYGAPQMAVQGNPRTFHATGITLEESSRCGHLRAPHELVTQEHVNNNPKLFWPCGSCFPGLWNEEPWYSARKEG